MQTRFGPFTIDEDARQLFRGDVELHLSPKAFDLLCVLLRERPRVIARRDLHARIWPGTHVVDANLNVLVAEIRRVLGDDAQAPRYIRTVHGVGFSFCGQTAGRSDEPGPADRLVCWLASPEETFRLKAGENTVGRDPRCDVFLDVPGVSRRHASITVDTKNATVELRDLGSTNGTLLRRTPLIGPASLADGDVIAIGSVELTVRLWRPDRMPETQRIRR